MQLHSTYSYFIWSCLPILSAAYGIRFKKVNRIQDIDESLKKLKAGSEMVSIVAAILNVEALIDLGTRRKNIAPLITPDVASLIRGYKWVIPPELEEELRANSQV